MKIAHIESSMNWGGKELRIIEQMQWLLHHGYPSALIARPQSAILKEALQRSLPCFALAMERSFDIGTLLCLHKILKENQFDVLDSHHNRDASYAFIMKFSLPIAVVRSVHMTGKINIKGYKKYIWQYGQHAVVTTATAIKDALLATGLVAEEKIHVATPGVDPTKFSRTSNLELKLALGIPERHLVVANIGMIREDKGQVYFLEAANRVAEQYADITFLQIGAATSDSQPYFNQLLKLKQTLAHQKRIHFLGYRVNIEDYLALADIVVISSIRTEAQTRLVSQAYFSHTNVIGTQVGGLPEMIEHGSTGLLCPPESAESLAAAILNLALDPLLREKLAQAAMNKADELYTFEKMMEGMLACYQQACRDTHQKKSVFR